MESSRTQCDWTVLGAQRKNRDAWRGFPEKAVLPASLCRKGEIPRTGHGGRTHVEEHVGAGRGRGWSWQAPQGGKAAVTGYLLPLPALWDTDFLEGDGGLASDIDADWSREGGEEAGHSQGDKGGRLIERSDDFSEKTDKLERGMDTA